MSDSTAWTPDFGTLNATAPTWNAKRPLRIALLGDFGAGALKGRLETGSELAARRPLSVEFDTLDDAIARMELQLQLPLGADGSNVGFDISELESFHPDELYRNLKVFSALTALRKRLNNAVTFTAAANELQKMVGAPRLPRQRKARARGAAPSSAGRLSDFARLTGRPMSASPETSVDALLRSMVGPFVKPSPNPAKDAMLGTLDRALSEAMRSVLHQADFQNLESLWRGVDFLLRRLETGPQLQVHLIDVSAEEFAADLSRADDLSESGLYKLLVQRPEKEAAGGYSLLCGCYQFDATPPHAELLGRMSQIAAQAGAAFITGIRTDPFCEARPHPLVSEAFNALKGLASARLLSLYGPRFMLRLPYGKRSDPISSFAFEEFSLNEGLGGMLWGHAGLLAVCALVGQGGKTTLADIPFYSLVDAAGDHTVLPSTERLLTERLATRLRQFGIGALQAHKGEPMVRLAALQAVNGDELTLNASKPAAKKLDSRVQLSARMPSEQPGRGAASAKGKAADASDESSGSGSDDSAGDSSSDSTSDSSLDDLLAGMGDSGSGSDDSSSLGSESDSASSDDSASTTEMPEAEMDPELAALLKSLE